MALAAGTSALQDLLAIGAATADGAGRRAGLERAAALSPANWRYTLELARLDQATGRHQSALERYTEAIERFPGCGRCWLGIAECQDALGEDPIPALSHAVALGSSETAVRTRAGVVYAKRGLEDEAAREFSAALGGRRDDRTEFYALLHRMYDPTFVLSRVVTDGDLGSYFAFARSRLDPGEVKAIWDRYRQTAVPAEEQTAYVRYLLKHGLAHDAWEIAHSGPPPPLGTVLDGGFEAADRNRPFGWRVTDGEGVRARISQCTDCESGRSALHLRFDGEHNVHYFGAVHTVPVVGGANYILRAKIKYDEVSGANGPGLFVRGLPIDGGSMGRLCSFQVAGERLAGTSDWRESTLHFTVPASCQGVQIVVARPRTQSLDQFAAGELWVDDVRLDPAPSAPTEQAAEDANPTNLAGGPA